MSLKRNRYVCLAAMVMTLALGGCGGAGERIQGAMQMIGELNYQGALEQLDMAEAEGENRRLVDRARGIAYMGLTDYEQAAVCFEEALAGSDGLVQSLDYDLNFYLAAAYTKNGRYAEAEDIYDAVLDLRPGEEDAYFLRGRKRILTRSYPWIPPIMTG